MMLEAGTAEAEAAAGAAGAVVEWRLLHLILGVHDAAGTIDTWRLHTYMRACYT